jgi:hypothetical protein
MVTVVIWDDHCGAREGWREEKERKRCGEGGRDR